MEKDYENIQKDRKARAAALFEAGGFDLALHLKMIPETIETTLSEALILGLIRQQVKKFIVVLGHGTTEIGEVLRMYEQEGVIQTFQVRNEIEGSHAAMALRWVCGEKAAVVTSIGPGALQACAASLTALSDGIGLWYILGDETVEDEGPNMQQIPGSEQLSFLRMCSSLGHAYCLHTPMALPTALRKGFNTVDHPYRGQPFYLLVPMNTQATVIPSFTLRELPRNPPPRYGSAVDPTLMNEAVAELLDAEKVVVKCGGGSRTFGREIQSFLELVDGVAVLTPTALGTIPFDHPRNMTVGGSKGSISGNYAMENADCLVVIGSRSVCQSDCSRTGYPKVRKVIAINTDLNAATHYHDTIALVGDGRMILKHLNQMFDAVKERGRKTTASAWLHGCIKKRKEWDHYRKQRYDNPLLYDEQWKRKVLTQPAAIHTTLTWAKSHHSVVFFDAGDVQANGFQIDESNSSGNTFTETGASYMGWAASSLLVTAMAKKPFYGVALCGDGSFTMNPQILIDGTAHKAQGCIVLLDNRRMGAISGLQLAQYGHAYATGDSVNVDYVKWAQAIEGVKGIHGGYSVDDLKRALDTAFLHKGISLVVVPVYFGPNALGSMGVFGRWNVGPWTRKTQDRRHSIGL